MEPEQESTKQNSNPGARLWPVTSKATRFGVAGAGASCHVGYRSCFYRSVSLGEAGERPRPLRQVEAAKVFDPGEVYGDAPNPTRL